jgi:hypothetical protein
LLWDEIGAPHEAALARHALAAALRAQGNDTVASREEQTARSILSRLRSGASLDNAARLRTPPADRPSCFSLEGELWNVSYAGKTIRLGDRKGLHYLARLLAEPDRRFHVLELTARESHDSPPMAVSSSLGDAGPHLDDRAKNAYRRRLKEIEADLDEATARNDLGRIGQAQAEREFLMRELSRAIDQTGRDRRAGAASERARVGVTRALRRALKQIRDHHEPLAEHFERTISTGTYCVYSPDPQARVNWEL